MAKLKWSIGKTVSFEIAIGGLVMDNNLDELYNDGEHILYINGAYRGDDEIGNLMHDFNCSDPNEMKDKDLADASRYYKETEEGVNAVCKVMEDMRNEAIKIKAIDVAVKILKRGKMTYEEIAEDTGLSLEEIEVLAKGQSA